MLKLFALLTAALIFLTICISSWYFKYSKDVFSEHLTDVPGRNIAHFSGYLNEFKERKDTPDHLRQEENYDRRPLSSRKNTLKKLNQKEPEQQQQPDVYRELHKVWLRLNHTDETVALQTQKISQQRKEIDRLRNLLRKEDNNNNNISNASKTSDPLLSKKIEKVFQYIQKQENKRHVERYSRRLSMLPTKPFTASKIIHLDLKGSPPRISYLLKFMAEAKRYGANGFLIEYEDMFPWSGNLSIVARETAYRKEDIGKILQKASQLDMQVIPLVQTYGHLEFVLKHEQFKRLRRLRGDFRSINPTRKESVPLVEKLIDQILELHPDIKWFHIGGDEVYDLEYCDGCNDLQMTSSQIYLHHMIPILKYVRSKRNSKGEPIIPIIWEDMFRKWEVDDIREIAKYAVPMIWAYVENLSNYGSFSKNMWVNYAQSFPSVFFASAFKGASHQDTDLMEVDGRARNHLDWLKIATLFEKIGIKVEGIILTGWSRFSHVQPLCELLPVGTPSLVLCLEILKAGTYNDTVIDKVSRMLGMEMLIGQTGVLGNPDKYNSTRGHFLGADVYTVVESVAKLDRTISSVTRYHYGQRTKKEIDDARTYMEQMEKLKGEVVEVFPKYFYEDTTTEWIETKIAKQLVLLNNTVVKYEKQLELNALESERKKRMYKLSNEKHSSVGNSLNKDASLNKVYSQDGVDDDESQENEEQEEQTDTEGMGNESVHEDEIDTPSPSLSSVNRPKKFSKNSAVLKSVKESDQLNALEMSHQNNKHPLTSRAKKGRPQSPINTKTGGNNQPRYSSNLRKKNTHRNSNLRETNTDLNSNLRETNTHRNSNLREINTGLNSNLRERNTHRNSNLRDSKTSRNSNRRNSNLRNSDLHDTKTPKKSQQQAQVNDASHNSADDIITHDGIANNLSSDQDHPHHDLHPLS